MANNIESVNDVPCGNIAGLAGIDKYLMKTGTVSDNTDAFPIRNMKYSVSPVVRVALSPKNKQDLPKFLDGLLKLVKSDPLL